MEENKLGTGILLAGAAAIIGGLVWALIAIYANYELAIVAWGIGFIAGYAVVLPSKKVITRAHQVVAVLASIIGISFGKYLIFVDFIRESYFSVRGFSLFFKNLDVVFSAFDILFILLAIVSAWQIPIRVAHQAVYEEAEAEALAQAQAEAYEQKQQAETTEEVKDEKETN